MNDPKKVKHGGCKFCGSKEQEILSSVKIAGEIMGAAICDKCAREKNIDIKTGWGEK